MWDGFFVKIIKEKGRILLLSDLIIIFIVFIVSYYVRAVLGGYIEGLVPISDLGQYARGGFVFSIIWVFLIWNDGGYQSGVWGLNIGAFRLRGVASSGAYALAILMIISFLYRGMLLSRLVYLFGFLFSMGLLLLSRYLFKNLERSLAKRDIKVHGIVVVGMNDEVRKFLKLCSANIIAGKFLGKLSWHKDSSSTSDLIPELGPVDAVEVLHEKHNFDMVVVPPQDKSDLKSNEYDEKIINLVNFCDEKGIVLYMLPGSYDVAVSKHEVGSFSGIPLIRLRDTSLHPVYAVFKSLIECVVAILVLVIGAPIWFILAIRIKLDSKGVIFFKQVRAGVHGKPFTMYKFRTMKDNAEASLPNLISMDKLDEPVFKIKNDPRVTGFGKFLRRTGLDEIPQLLNVIKGEMSIVGPRPEEVKIVSKYNPYQRRRLKAKPGITGFQQIMNRGEPDLSERIKHDLNYLKHQGPILDLYIIFKTIGVMFKGKGVTH